MRGREAKDGWEGSGGFGGDGEGFPLAIFEGSGGVAEDDAVVAFDGKSGEPSGWEDGAGRDEKPTLVDAERDASRSEDGLGSNYWRGLGYGRREYLEQRED